MSGSPRHFGGSLVRENGKAPAIKIQIVAGTMALGTVEYIAYVYFGFRFPSVL